MKKVLYFVILSLLIILSACSSKNTDTEQIPNGSESGTADLPQETLEPYADIRYFEGVGRKKELEEGEYKREDIVTYIFNQDTVLLGSEELQAQVMENGKNPGLGVRALHERGITGEGVNVAIIDQNLLLNHPEFSGKIAAYHDTGCEQDEGVGSMHGPAVTSLLVGNTIGVAPGAKVYYAAAPSWTGDSSYYSQALYWIMEENRKLPDDEKIRVVSVSAAPSGEGPASLFTFTKNQQMWDEAVLAAQQEGILVLDCRNDPTTGVIGPAFYNPEHPDNVSLCAGGFPKKPSRTPSWQIGAPASYRTSAEEYFEGSPSYQYTGEGGTSWAIPYAAGVLALGWQINPALESDQIVQILFDTGAMVEDGSRIIDPAAFIDAVEKTK